MAFDLLQAVLDNGIDNTHYFNGRILTADALRDDQQAQRRQRQQLGRAIGAGIVQGLTVRHVAGSDPPTLRVSAGLALNAQGQALELPNDADVALARGQDAGEAGGGLFVACRPLDTGEYVTGRNLYVLAMAPASGYREKAPLYDLSANGSGRAEGCGFRYATEGVQFRLVEIDLDNASVISGAAKTAVEALITAEPQTPAGQNRLRNLMAHLCLGTTDTAAIPTDLFAYLAYGATPPAYGLLARITDPDPAGADEYTLTPCDVPLALLYWTTAGVQFVDMWAVRRRTTRPEASPFGLPLTTDRRLAEGEAAFWQFQTQIAEMTRPGIPQAQLSIVRADNHFRYLPAAGVIPIRESAAERGFIQATFFGGIITPEAVHIEGDRLPRLLQRSFSYPPITIGSVEFVRLYMVRQNRQAIDEGSGAAPTRYLVFTSGHLPYEGVALFDQAHIEYSNYGR